MFQVGLVNVLRYFRLHDVQLGRRGRGEGGEREERGRRVAEKKEGEEERIFQTKADTNNSLLPPPFPPSPTHLSSEGQKIVVEMYI